MYIADPMHLLYGHYCVYAKTVESARPRTRTSGITNLRRECSSGTYLFSIKGRLGLLPNVMGSSIAH